ncbi:MULTISPECIES: DMT family transporter [Gulbenkiania]|uniref:Multidrug transporter EmrE and related cation transporters n=1 Tax=Gulbenkiania indica TaxID=375574 RepID=A0A0K6H2K8_9NEIS|nr:MULTISPECIES: multidrug efflux SMR transporter [Gulbenkiania]CUA85213.1 Multidrug transporter EmrE and related cation transporters [Gulbenkiania indica]
MTGPLSPWLMLAGAIAAELVATSSLKLAQGFSRPLPSLVVIIGYMISFWLLSRVVERLELGIVYAVWCGVGMAVVAVIGVVVYGESVSLLKTAGILAIVLGTVLLSLAGKGA